MSNEQLEKLVDNALEFLLRAITEFESAPKFSIIDFYTAVELFLKARLLAEHWSLIVSKDPDADKFVSGDFVSVTFDEACTRLAKVLKSAIPDTARRNFDAVRRHRNKMVHFFHKDLSGTAMEDIAIEQLRAWHDLQRLLTQQWQQVFEQWAGQLRDVEKRLNRHREYLRAKFEALAPDLTALKESGVPIVVCRSCNFKAARSTELIKDLYEARCLVCGSAQSWLRFACPECDVEGRIEDGGEFRCESCKAVISESKLIDLLDENVVTPDNYFDNMLPANCGNLRRVS